MMDKGFSVGSLLRKGWKAMEKNLAFFIGALLLVWIIPPLIPWIVPQTQPIFGIAYIVSTLMGFLLQIGWVKVGLSLVKKGEVNFADLFKGFPSLIRYFLGTVLYVLIVSLGFICLIVPGIYLSIRFWAYPYYIVDQGLGPVEALKASSRATNGAKLDILALTCLGAVFVFLSVFTFGLGLFAVIPMMLFAQVSAYLTLDAQTKGLPPTIHANQSE